MYLLLRKSRPKKSRDLKFKINHTQSGANLNIYLLLRKSRPKKSRDIKYIIKAHMQRGGSKYISFVEKVKTEEELRKKNASLNLTHS